MNAYEPIGYLASLLVLATFCMRGMVALRLVAIASNVAFIAYGALADIGPVLLLHVLLLPTNAWRLCEALRDQRLKSGPATGGREREGAGAGQRRDRHVGRVLRWRRPATR